MNGGTAIQQTYITEDDSRSWTKVDGYNNQYESFTGTFELEV